MDSRTRSAGSNLMGKRFQPLLVTPFPAQAGIQRRSLDSSLRWSDGYPAWELRCNRPASLLIRPLNSEHLRNNLLERGGIYEVAQMGLRRGGEIALGAELVLIPGWSWRGLRPGARFTPHIWPDCQPAGLL